MSRRLFAGFMLGVTIVLAVWAVARLAELQTPFPSWRQPAVVDPVNPSVTPAVLPRTLRTATQGAS